MKTNEIKTEIERLKVYVDDKIKKLEYKLNQPDDGYPAVGTEYFVITAMGSVQRTKWENVEGDHELFNRGNFYLTREAAERKVKQDQVLVKMRKYTKGFVPDWSDCDQYKYYPGYCHQTKTWGASLCSFLQENFLFPHFASKADCKEMLAALGDEMNVFIEGGR